jgi:hypothetical protein
MTLHSKLAIGLLILTGTLSGCSGSPSSQALSPTADVSPATSEPAPQPINQADGVAGAAGDAAASPAASEPAPQPINQAGGVADAAQVAADADWTVTIRPDATILIQHRGAPVVKEVHVTWAEKKPQAKMNDWVPTKFRTESVRDGQGTLSGEIPRLDLKARGRFRRVADNELRVDYEFQADKRHAPIKGAVLDWKFELKSPSFDGPVSDPVLLENNLGWTWTVGPGQAVTVRFDEPLDLNEYEMNRKNNIRSYYYANQVEPGRRRIGYTVRLPEGGRIAPSPEERYGPVDTTGWFRDALSWDAAPVDLSFLNAPHRPAGRHGRVRADGDRFVFEDGTEARFWGANLAANALFSTPRENVARQAHRMSQLGYNVIRLHQLDAPYAKPNIFGLKYTDTRHISPDSLEKLDWWITCLKDEGIYIWMDIAWLRIFTPADGDIPGLEELKRHQNTFYGYNYFNSAIMELMREFQGQLLGHVNRYTKLAYKDDSAIVAILISNENDVTWHFGHRMLPTPTNPVHNAVFKRGSQAFAKEHGLPPNQVSQTWLPGPSKLYLADVEHRFNRAMIDDLRNLGVRAPLVTTNFWSGCAFYSLPPLADGDMIDVHSYGEAEELSANPRYVPNFLSWIGAAQVEGKPLSVSEWSVLYPTADRFTAPLYLAGIAALQGWDMPIIAHYAQGPLQAPGKANWQRKVGPFSTYSDPAICGVLPAAAVAYRQGHIRAAKTHYYLRLTPDQLFGQELNPATTATVRTLVEQSRLTIGLPSAKELPWLKPTRQPSSAVVVTDPNRDFIPTGESSVRSDTGELVRDWNQGIQTIDSPKTQAVLGWIGGKSIQLRDATFAFRNPKALVALTSIDDQPLSRSRFILITAMARAVAETPDYLPFLSEPVVGTVTLRSQMSRPRLLALGANGGVQESLTPEAGPDGLTFRLPTRRGTHWYVLRSGDSTKAGDEGKTKSSE